jgi:hypothetical protein
MSLRENIKYGVKSEKTPRLILYAISIAMLIDISLTDYILTSIVGSNERNPAAYFFIRTFGIIPGLLILSLLSIIFLIMFGMILKGLVPKIVKNEKVDCLLVSNGIWIFILLFVLIQSFKGIVNNLLILLVSF